MASPGIVYLVGAGPGDPGLLTIRALELLQSADVVAHDELITPEVLALASPSAELLPVGRRRGPGSTSYRIHPLVLDRARQGRRVVRLKCGDPLVFGRGGEEAEELTGAGIRFEIVPGISAALGAAAHAGIPLTHRDICSDVTLATGHDVDGTRPSHSRWGALAPGRGTVVIYMASHKLGENLRRLEEAGRDPKTPAAYVASATMAEQHVVVGTVRDLAARVEGAKGTGPALVIVGEVVARRDMVAWREARPLSGRRVVMGRSRPGPSRIARGLRDLGAVVVEAPRVEARALPAVDLRESLRDADAVLFACATSVEMLAPHLASLGSSLPRVVAVGEAASASLRRAGIATALELHGACRDALHRAGTLLRGATVVLFAGSDGRPALVADLAELGASVTTVPLYVPVHVVPRVDGIAFHLVVLPSSSSARALLGSGIGPGLRALPTIAMGPRTEAAARELGSQHVVLAPEDSIESLLLLATSVLQGDAAPVVPA